jgi:hypothetical protein
MITLDIDGKIENSYLSEIAYLQEIISEIEEGEVIDQMSFKSRLKNIQAELKQHRREQKELKASKAEERAILRMFQNSE